MLLHSHPGPPEPPRLITIQSARRHNFLLSLHCEPCGRHQHVDGATLPIIPKAVCLGELWLAGRFRCAGCRRPATQLDVIERELSLNVKREVWRLGDPLVPERLRRHWRWDPWDRKDWPAWFKRR
ncbi:hypothetical protein GGQ87_000382 [Brevundimonas alba]|uniref:Uncharacterized protein n=1 Tax=Brevundimonas alba TaxID=74314 RepID=A0A7X5YI82_9CAUL|nr:hypothetical protein [Brevundimonas alba]NJC40124.1 hypothetical protein [Brevundimonas alba]